MFVKEFSNENLLVCYVLIALNGGYSCSFLWWSCLQLIMSNERWSWSVLICLNLSLGFQQLVCLNGIPKPLCFCQLRVLFQAHYLDPQFFSRYYIHGNKLCWKCTFSFVCIRERENCCIFMCLSQWLESAVFICCQHSNPQAWLKYLYTSFCVLIVPLSQKW